MSSGRAQYRKIQPTTLKGLLSPARDVQLREVSNYSNFMKKMCILQKLVAYEG